MEATTTTTLAAVTAILAELDVDDVDAGSVLVAEEQDAAGLLDDRGFGRFMGRFCVRMGCLPYSADEVAGLTLVGFCERYLADSFPSPPEATIEDSDYEMGGPPRGRRAEYPPFDEPICFVLGIGRSGTTLLRAMLDIHQGLWAPGELHLAGFDTMDERASGLANPFLRNAFVEEAAERCGEPAESFAARLEEWQRTGLSTLDVYRHLHAADPGRLIVDKTPSYSMWPEDLAWIVRHFPDARFVHLVRNPSDVIRSLVRMRLHEDVADRFAPGLAAHHVAEALWVRHNRNIPDALSAVAEDRHTVVRFEDLVADPAEALTRVCDLVGVAFDPAMADPYAAASGPIARGAGDPRVNLLGRVERRDPAAPTHPFGDRTRELALQFGY